LLLSVTAARADDGCTKDTDCKGERICVQHLCVDPPANAGSDAPLPPPVPAAGAAAAAYHPGAPPPPPGEAAPSPVAAGPIADGRHRHLGGYFRPDLGLGYLTTSASQSGTSASMSGLAGTFGLAAGGALSENHILAVHLWDAVVSDPSLSYGGSSGPGSGTVALIGIGPEYTYYSRQNVYFSISPSLTRMSTSLSGSSASTNWGFGARAALGKEWWVSDHWGLGLVGHLSMSFNQDQGTNPPTWTSWAFTAAFSATYN
jgi:hypothetical protein